jgi:hypothetical protein
VARTDGKGSFLVSPKSALDRFVPPLVSWASRVGVDGLAFRDGASVLLSDAGHGLTRAGSAQIEREIFSLVRSRGMSVRVDGGAAWALGAVSSLTSVPLRSAGFLFSDGEEAVYPVALHGLVGMISAPVNLTADMEAQVLRCVELGVTPSVEVTAADPVILKDTTANGLFRSQYREVIGAVAGIATMASRAHPSLAGTAMLGHAVLSAGVTRTLYADGTEVIVNHSDGDYVTRDASTRSGAYLMRAAGKGEG